MLQEILIAILIILAILCLFYLAHTIHELLTEPSVETTIPPQDQMSHGGRPPPPRQMHAAPAMRNDIIRVRILDADNILNHAIPEDIILQGFDQVENMMLHLLQPHAAPRHVHPPPNVAATNKKEATAQYYEGLEEHDNDSQNVHNSNILYDLTGKYNRLLELCKISDEFLQSSGMNAEDLHQAKKSITFQQIRQKAKVRYKDKTEELHKIELFLSEVEKGAAIMSISPNYEQGNIVHEDQVLELVWERIHAPANNVRHHQLEIALFDQMIDGVRKSDFLGFMNQFVNAEPAAPDTLSPVCVNGRVARMLTSLTLLDADPILAEPEKDDKELINIAYIYSSNILQRELKNWPHSNGMRTMEEIYNDIAAPSTVEKSELIKFGEHARKEIEKELRSKYTDLLESNVLEDTIKKALAGVETEA